jgi:hypothetical protein
MQRPPEVEVRSLVVESESCAQSGCNLASLEGVCSRRTCFEGMTEVGDAAACASGNCGRDVEARCPWLRCCGQLSQPPRCEL